MRAQAIAMAIGQKMDQLEKELNMAITRKVAENFKDPTGPLNALTQAALAPLGRDVKMFYSQTHLAHCKYLLECMHVCLLEFCVHVCLCLPLFPLFLFFSTSLTSTLDTPNREEVFVKRAADFKQHAGKMSDTATALAKSGIVTDRKLADDLISTAGKVGGGDGRVQGGSVGKWEGREREEGGMGCKVMS